MSIFAELAGGIATASPEETHDVARRLAESLPNDATLALHGDLGVGKTTFVQGLARGFGISHAITSPTFTLFNLYRGPQRMLLHLDAYRLERPQGIEQLMIDDFLISPFCLAIEWPEKVGDWLPADALHLHLSISPDRSHLIRLLPESDPAQLSAG